MTFLIDANLSRRVARGLPRVGFDAIHVNDVGLLHASDEKILAHAVAKDQVIISSDSDFATLLALQGLPAPSLVLLRSADALTPDEQVKLLVLNLPALKDELAAGAVASLSTQHLRVRRLPMCRPRGAS